MRIWNSVFISTWVCVMQQHKPGICVVQQHKPRICVMQQQKPWDV